MAEPTMRSSQQGGRDRLEVDGVTRPRKARDPDNRRVRRCPDQLATYLCSASRATSLTVRPSAFALFFARSKRAGATR
jgi:hypothetical protein